MVNDTRVVGKRIVLLAKIILFTFLNSKIFLPILSQLASLSETTTPQFEVVESLSTCPFVRSSVLDGRRAVLN
jgi:hypothetical protein